MKRWLLAVLAAVLLVAGGIVGSEEWSQYRAERVHQSCTDDVMAYLWTGPGKGQTRQEVYTPERVASVDQLCTLHGDDQLLVVTKMENYARDLTRNSPSG